MSFWVFWICGRETKYSHTSLLEPSNRKTCSSLSIPISSEIFLTIFSCFFTWLWICWGKTISNVHAHDHMTVVFSYHCHDSNTNANNSHTITTIAQPYFLLLYIILYSWICHISYLLLHYHWILVSSLPHLDNTPS